MTQSLTHLYSKMLLLQVLAASPSAPTTDKQERNMPRPWQDFLSSYLKTSQKCFFYSITFWKEYKLVSPGWLVSLALQAREPCCKPGVGSGIKIVQGIFPNCCFGHFLRRGASLNALFLSSVDLLSVLVDIPQLHLLSKLIGHLSWHEVPLER